MSATAQPSVTGATGDKGDTGDPGLKGDKGDQGDPGPQGATLRVFDVRGRKVRVLVRDELAAGVHEATWNGRNEDGTPMAAGVYFLRLETEGRRYTLKLLLAR